MQEKGREKMENEKRKQALIKKMLEAKKIEIENNEKNVIYKITNLFSKPKKTAKERIDALNKSLEKKEADELEYMILQKEGSLLLLEKRVSNPEEKLKLKELIDELNELKKKEGKREKIAREVGFKKKEIKELKKEVEEKVVIDKPEPEKTEIKEKTAQAFSGKKAGKNKSKEKKVKIKPGRKKAKTSLKKKNKALKKAEEKKTAKQVKAEKGKKTEIRFTSPLEELKQKREKEIKAKRQEALDKFHNEFTSGNSTYVNIKGGARIIAGKQQAGSELSDIRKQADSELYEIKGKTDEQFDFDIAKIQQKIKNLKSAFFHRQINEQDYKKKLFDYQEELT